MNTTTTEAAMEDENENYMLIHIVTSKKEFIISRTPRPAMTIYKCLCQCRGTCKDEGKEDTMIIVLPDSSFHISRERYFNLMWK